MILYIIIQMIIKVLEDGLILLSTNITIFTTKGLREGDRVLQLGRGGEEEVSLLEKPQNGRKLLLHLEHDHGSFLHVRGFRSTKRLSRTRNF
jgi:hypothetical protein